MLRTDLEAITYFRVDGTSFQLVDPGNTVAAETLHASGYEPALLKILDEIAGTLPVSTFCDVGSLHGYYPALVAARYPGWKVNAYEPNPVAYKTLQHNFMLNKVAGFTKCLALGEDNKPLYFKGRTIVASTETDAILVPSKTFDEIYLESSLQDAVVKIDVHGAEGLVLRGMRRTLGHRIPHLLIEVHAEHLIVGQYRYLDMLIMLEKAGYVLSELKNFRTTEAVDLVPMSGRQREEFVEFSNWTDTQKQTERLLYARFETSNA